jgi:hypothetical protein
MLAWFRQSGCDRQRLRTWDAGHGQGIRLLLRSAKSDMQMLASAGETEGTSVNSGLCVRVFQGRASGCSRSGLGLSRFMSAATKPGSTSIRATATSFVISALLLGLTTYNGTHRPESVLHPARAIRLNAPVPESVKRQGRVSAPAMLAKRFLYLMSINPSPCGS